MLQMLGFERVAFADDVREEVRWALTGPNRPMLPTHSHDDCWSELLRDRDSLYRKPTSPDARIILQWWGTEHRRSQDTGYWVKKLFGRLSKGQEYVITDVRFKNESDAIHAAGGEVWKIEREDLPDTPKHVSEELVGVEPDRIIHNTTLNRLVQEVKNALAGYDERSRAVPATQTVLDEKTLRHQGRCRPAAPVAAGS